MPPKPKFTKDEIAQLALSIIKTEGVDSLTARNLGTKMGSSARPIFTVFNSMEEVKLAAREIALREFEEYASDFEGYKPAFKRIGMLMVEYAIHEPETFKLLFMQEHKNQKSFDNTLSDLGNMVDICIGLIEKDYGLSAEKSKILFEQMWIHAYGLSSLCAMKVCDFNEEEISKRLGQVFMGLTALLKSDRENDNSVMPEKDAQEK